MQRAPIDRKDGKCLGHATALGRQSVDEVGYWNMQPNICIDSHCFRSAEVAFPQSDPSKAKEKLGWVPESRSMKWCGRWLRLIWQMLRNRRCFSGMDITSTLALNE
jgi:GDP-D-mannose dehydratase